MNSMKLKQEALSRRYVAALRQHLKNGSSNNGSSSTGSGKNGYSRADSMASRALGFRALADGHDTLVLARIHDNALIDLVAADGLSSADRKTIVRRAGAFFADTIKPLENTRRLALEANRCLIEHNKTLRQHTLELAASNRRFEREIIRRRAVEESLRKGKLHFAQLLAQSKIMEEQLRVFSHKILLAQEAERKEISRELHDQIAQTLSGINVHLASLKTEVISNSKGLAQKITKTQRIVEKSVDIVHRFARDLRPTVLDDLGLLPALRAYLNEYTERTHLPVNLIISGGVEDLSEDRRTVLYRVAQAALTNIDQHAKATKVTVKISKINNEICMVVQDNGSSFDVERVLFAKRHKRLGVLGMRERVEMIGGNFVIKSVPAKGTSITVCVPARKESKSLNMS